MLCERSQKVFHSRSAQPRQEDHGEEDKVDIIEAGAIRFGRRVEVLQGKKLGGVGLRLGQ